MTEMSSFFSMPEAARKSFAKLGPALHMNYAPPPGVTPEMLAAAGREFLRIWDVAKSDDDCPALEDSNWGDIFGYVWAAMNEARTSSS